MGSIMSWIVAHQALVAGLGVAILDFVFAINPNLNGSGVIHAIYTLLVKDVQAAPPAA